MNILFVVQVFPKLSETFILNQVVGLLERGHTVTILSYLRPEQAGAADEPAPAEAARRGLLERTLYFDEEVGPIENLFWFNVQPRLRHALQEADVILAHFAHTATQVAERLAHFAARPFTFFAHGFDLYAAGNPLDLVQAARAAHAVITVSEFNRAALLARLPVELHDRVHVLYSGIDVRRWVLTGAERAARERETSPLRIVSVGRLVEKKGGADAIAAFARLLGAHPASELHLIGDGPLRGPLQALARELGVAARVHFEGWRASAEVMATLKRAHIFLLPSCAGANGDREGLPKTIVEAAALELPVVATRHTGIPEIVADAESGFLVAEHDVAALAARLDQLAGAPALRCAMGRRGREIVLARFDVREEINGLTALLQDMQRAATAG